MASLILSDSTIRCYGRQAVKASGWNTCPDLSGDPLSKYCNILFKVVTTSDHIVSCVVLKRRCCICLESLFLFRKYQMIYAMLMLQSGRILHLYYLCSLCEEETSALLLCKRHSVAFAD